MTDETNESLFRAFQSTRKRVTSDEEGEMTSATAYIYLDDQFPKGFADHGSILESLNIEILTGTPSAFMDNDLPFDGKEFYGMMIDRSWYEAPSQQFDTLEDLEKVLFEWLMGEQYEDLMKAAHESLKEVN